jgi:hypothetical protein
MANAFESWTVLKHGPLEKLSENLWRVDGSMPNPNIRRAMTIARMKDGRLVIHNAVALEAPLMAEIEAFGTPAIIVVPNGFHRQDAKIYKDRYPSAAVYAPKGSIAKVSQVVPVTGDYADAPKDDTVQLRYLEGCKNVEGVLEVKSSDGKTVTFTDVICNVPKRTGFFGFLLAPTGEPSVPRISRWMIVKDKKKFVEQLGEIATPDLRRVIVTHGKMIDDRPAETIKTVASALS